MNHPTLFANHIHISLLKRSFPGAAKFCRQSAYKLPCATVLKQKLAIGAECKLVVVRGKPVQRKNGCCTLLQTVANEVRDCTALCNSIVMYS